MEVDITSNSPENLFLMEIYLLLKKLIIEPIITTGCILPGSSPNMTSIASETKNIIIININNFNEIILLESVNINSLINLIIFIIIYNKKINNLLLILSDDIMDIEEKVKKWLSDEDLLREMKYDENADFHFIVEFPKENIMDVVKPKNKDSLIIACATQVAPQHLDLIKQADPSTRKEFIMDLNFGLNNFLVDFELQINQDILQHFVVTDQIFEDGLTKHTLITTLKRVFKAKLHCIWLIDQKFGDISLNIPPQNENDMFI